MGAGEEAEGCQGTLDRDRDAEAIQTACHPIGIGELDNIARMGGRRESRREEEQKVFDERKVGRGRCQGRLLSIPPRLRRPICREVTPERERNLGVHAKRVI